MMPRYLRLFATLGLLSIAPRAGAQESEAWTFVSPPIEHLRRTYGLETDSLWFENARLGALRLPGCSASLVSSSGLVASSHACIRSYISDIEYVGERLLEEGFYAYELANERRVPGLVAEQLIAINEVSGDAAESQGGPEEFFVEVRPSEDSLRSIAYTFRRYDDVRVVMAPEDGLASFGEATYPRYSLGFSFLRIYEDDDRPLETESYFAWRGGGVLPGDVVLSIGGPQRAPELSDGVVQGFEHNGATAPPYTTYFGLYDLHHGHAGWDLPESWRRPVATFDLSTPLNFVATTPCPEDGAPMLNVDLEVVGIAFDQTSSAGAHHRCVAMSAAGIVEALREVYDARLLVLELQEEALPPLDG